MKKGNKGCAKNRIKHEKFKDFNITLLDEHERIAGKLLSSFANLEDKIQKTSWIDNAINEALWAVILCGNMDQKDYLELFRELIINARKNIVELKETFITHSALSVLSEELFDQLMGPILKNEDAKKLLSGLLYFECPPDRNHWLRHLNNPANPNSHSEIVMKGVLKCFNHKSQESTDIRWLKVMHVIMVQEKLHFPKTITEELREFSLYPDYGDQRIVRPTIRSVEQYFRTSNGNDIPPEIPKGLKDKIPAPWNNDFWEECYNKTECITQKIKKPEPPKKSEYFDPFFDTYSQLVKRFTENAKNTGIDAKRDTCFGIVLYSLYLGLGVASIIPLAQRAEGRMILRTIVENFITLKYLEKENKCDPEIWMKFRRYGTGKSKMVFLKNLQQKEIPNFINLQDLHNYANEDMWQEFSDIDLKSWTNKNLRELAEALEIKDFYDKHYDWSSGYVHGNWGAIRDTVFTVCLNPLHRFHRIPFFPRFDMPSVLPDIAETINEMLKVINHFYPLPQEGKKT